MQGFVVFGQLSEQTCLTFASPCSGNVRICCLSLSFVTVNEELFSSGLLVGRKRHNFRT